MAFNERQLEQLASLREALSAAPTDHVTAVYDTAGEILASRQSTPSNPAGYQGRVNAIKETPVPDGRYESKSEPRHFAVVRNGVVVDECHCGFHPSPPRTFAV